MHIKIDKIVVYSILLLTYYITLGRGVDYLIDRHESNSYQSFYYSFSIALII